IEVFMTKMLAIIMLLISGSVVAGTCKIKARVYESVFACPVISIKKFKDVSLQECEAYVKQGIDTALFGILDIKSGEKLMHVDYKFKDGKYTVKDRVVIEDWNDYCGGGIL